MDHTFKVGDLVQLKAGETILGWATAPFTVIEASRSYIYVQGSDGRKHLGGYFPSRFEPYGAPEAAFQIGDRIEIISSARSGGASISVGERGTIESEPNSAFPYITLDGRLGRFVMGRQKLLRLPTPITAKAAPKRDFKPGDEVRVNHPESSLYCQRGTIIEVGRYYASVSFRPGGLELVSLDHLTLVTTVVPQRDIPKGSPNLSNRPTSVGKHWFICVIDKDDEKPRPATVPRLYTSAEQARAVARSMAEKNRTETFVVYEATDVIVAPPVSLPETQHHKL